MGILFLCLLLLVLTSALRPDGNGVAQIDWFTVQSMGRWIVFHGDGLWSTLVGIIVALLGVCFAQRITSPSDESFAKIRVAVGFTGILIGATGATLLSLVVAAILAEKTLEPSLVVELAWAALVVFGGALMGAIFNATNEDRHRAARESFATAMRMNAHLGLDRLDISDVVARRCKRLARKTALVGLLPGAIALTLAALFDPIFLGSPTPVVIVLSAVLCGLLLGLGAFAPMAIIAQRRLQRRRWLRHLMSAGLVGVVAYQCLLSLSLLKESFGLAIASGVVAPLAFASMSRRNPKRRFFFLRAGLGYDLLNQIHAAEYTRDARKNLALAATRVEPSAEPDLIRWLQQRRGLFSEEH